VRPCAAGLRHVSVCLLLWGRVHTVVGVGTRAAAAHHWGHGLATAGTHWGRREARAEGLAALGEVLDGAVDLCGGVLALFSRLLGYATAMSCRIAHPTQH
jgi:hypothetical protein